MHHPITTTIDPTNIPITSKVFNKVLINTQIRNPIIPTPTTERIPMWQKPNSVLFNFFILFFSSLLLHLLFVVHPLSRMGHPEKPDP